MLHVSTDLFQTLALALLVVILLVLLMILTVLSRIRSAMPGTQTSSEQADSSDEPADRAQETVVAAAEPAIEDVAAATVSEPAASGHLTTGEPIVTSPTEPVSTASGSTSTASRDVYEPTSATASDEGHSLEGAAGAVTEGDADPQEQPFERDGRWYFRRGEELLVYDETAAQWIQAEGPRSVEPAGTFGASTGSYGATDDESTSSVTHTETMGSETSSAGSGWGAGAAALESDQPEETAPDSHTAATEEHTEIGQPAPAPADFWRCPSCGAINGSTAPTCRMCFTARP
ncbi:MAG: hypothetical protein QOF16_1167 [Actinomycetota bacterium]|nr:hypothetical protein [Actinomycetota bacterium]